MCTSDPSQILQWRGCRALGSHILMTIFRVTCATKILLSGAGWGGVGSIQCSIHSGFLYYHCFVLFIYIVEVLVFSCLVQGISIIGLALIHTRSVAHTLQFTKNISWVKFQLDYMQFNVKRSCGPWSQFPLKMIRYPLLLVRHMPPLWSQNTK